MKSVAFSTEVLILYILTRTSPAMLRFHKCPDTILTRWHRFHTNKLILLFSSSLSLRNNGSHSYEYCFYYPDCPPYRRPFSCHCFYYALSPKFQYLRLVHQVFNVRFPPFEMVRNNLTNPGLYELRLPLNLSGFERVY